jgi:hypothetical protein
MTEDRMAKMERQLDRLSKFVDEFEPIVRTLLASIPAGPLAWAMRRKEKSRV